MSIILAILWGFCVVLWYALNLLFVGVLFTIAGICYTLEHTYNYLTGKGWTGMSLR